MKCHKPLKNRFKMVKINILSLLIAIAATSHITNSKEYPKKCIIDRVYKMIAYDCKELKLTEIPKNLKTSVEILDVSVNRIKKLNKKSFSSYTKLKILYLHNNKIAKIETGTFAVLTDLETLDLSDNSFREVLPEIMDLPNLKRLSIAEIELKNDGFFKIRKPVKAPLMYLNIAETDIDQIPDFGILPSLKSLNVSLNSLTHIKAEQFAPLCRLETVDINETEISACQCAKINFFIENELQRNPLLRCEKTPKNCKIDQNSTKSETKNYLTCLSVKEELTSTRSAEISWQIPAFLAFICLFFIVMIYAHCCNAKPQNRPQQIELIHEADMPINPDSRSTLIM